MIFRVYKFATSSGVQINWIEKNGKVHRAFLIIYVSFFYGQCSFDIDDSAAEAKVDTEGTTFRSLCSSYFRYNLRVQLPGATDVNRAGGCIHY